MLTAIRDRATGWIAWAIVIIITIPFALWGINSYLEGLNEVVVAEVNGDDINYETYSRSLSQQRNFYQRSLRNQLGSEFFSSPEFKMQAVEALVEERLLNQEIDKLGLRVSDSQLSNLIAQTPQFQDSDGKFDRELYDRALIGSGYNAQGFEQAQRRQNELAQLRNGFSSSAFILKSRLDNALSLSEQKRKTIYTVVGSDKFLDDIEISAEAIEQAYKDNPDRYMASERMKLEYIRLSVADLGEKVDVSDEEVEAIYNSTRNDFGLPERRKARHILIKLDSDAEDAEAADKAALEKATDLAQRITGGEEFSLVASAESQDAGSKRKGGDLGYVGRGQAGIAPQFEATLFELEEGAVSDPVRTEYGYHLIRVDEIEAERIKPLEDAAEEIRTAEQRRKAEDQFIDMQEMLTNLAYEQPDTLAPAAEAVGLPIEQSEWVEPFQGDGVFATESVRNAAFSPAVKEDALNSDLIEVDVDTLVVLRKLEYEESKLRELDDVRDQIETELKREEAAKKAKEVGEALVNTLQASDDVKTTLDAELETLGLESVDLPESRNGARSASYELADAVFAAPWPDDGKPQVGGVEMSNGDYSVYVLESVEAADATAVDEAQRTRFTQLMEQRFGNESFQSFQTGLRAKADVVIREDEL